jgi:hypothetical protein
MKNFAMVKRPYFFSGAAAAGEPDPLGAADPADPADALAPAGCQGFALTVAPGLAFCSPSTII